MNSVIRNEAPDLAKVKLSTPFVLQLVAWLVAGLMTYGAMSARIAVVEARQGESDRRQSDADHRMERIELKLDRVLERLPR